MSADAAGPDPLWPEHVADSIKVIVLDFDKTITVKHTRGAIFQTALLNDAEIEKNFTDIEFLRNVVPEIARTAKVAIATYCDEEEESLLSGLALVRKYLDIAFGDKSKDYFPDKHIEAWNPENLDMDARHVGKNKHLANLRERLGCKKKEMVLFDDSLRNVQLARKQGYKAYPVDEPVPFKDGGTRDINENGPGGFCKEAWQRFLEKEASGGGGGGCIIA